MRADLGDVVEVVGRFVSASNHTFLGMTRSHVRVVYKPIAGERPLWDFTEGSLAIREALTWQVDEIMGLGIVPETIVAEGPLGVGSVQRFVEVDEEFDPLPLVRSADPDLWPVAVLDVVTNNADRKLGHILCSAGALVAVDHGLTFHPAEKLRTVLWTFAGQMVPDELAAAVDRLRAAVGGEFGARVEAVLGVRERVALAGRIDRLLADQRHPTPPDDRPPVPWPVY